MFFPDHAMVGEAVGEEGADRCLGIAVRLGDGAGVALGLDQQGGTEQGADDRPRQVGGLFGRRDDARLDQGAGAFGEMERR
jgi:hypothetical protein